MSVGTVVAAQTVAVSAPATVSAKTAAVTINVTAVALETVLRQIANQAGLAITYSDAVKKSPLRVTLHLKNVPAADAFAKALTGTSIKAHIVAGEVLFAEMREGVVPADQGTITGTVIDGKTKQPIRGASVLLDASTKGTTSGDDGRFRIANVIPGEHTVHVRMLGYVKAAKIVVVAEGQAASVELMLNPSVSALDQVVVTGTITATALKAVPNAITVITAKDIEARGITRIDQLFRGDVPGLFSSNSGSYNLLDGVTMFSRGATALTYESAGTDFNTNPIKTYVDGVELANPSYLSQIDPRSIERIEILTGPQASTIYGSNALNGVMQVFTKRGTSSRPQLTATLQGGWVENSYRSTLTPQHDDAIQLQGVEGHWSYTTGGSWNYVGPWTPSKQTTRLGGFGGGRLQRGQVSVDGSLRLAVTSNAQRGDPEQGYSALRETGVFTPSFSNGRSAPQAQSVTGQTLGLTLGYTPVAWWTHEVVLGQDGSASTSRYLGVGNATPSDTNQSLTQGTNTRTSWRYSTTVQGQVTRVAKVVVSVGGDGWKNVTTSTSSYAPSLSGYLNGSSVLLTPGHNAGGFLQAQLGFWDQLFLTYGLRAEWNPAFGAEREPNVAPRFGGSYARDVETPWGVVTTKLRASYGRSTRPPNPSYKQGVLFTQVAGGAYAQYYVPYFGNGYNVLPNPELGPEYQQGGEGGLELYFGTRASLVVTRYNQTVDDLISDFGAADSLRSLSPNVVCNVCYIPDADGYYWFYQTEYLNVGSLRNQGWEAQASLNFGPFTTKGTYSWTKSRIIGVAQKYQWLLYTSGVYRPGGSFGSLPEHTWAWGTTYSRAQTTVSLNVNGTAQIKSSQGNILFDGIQNGYFRLVQNLPRQANARIFDMAPGYVTADLNMTRRFSSSLEGILQVQNLGNFYQNDIDQSYAVLGRQSKVGVRMRW